MAGFVSSWPINNNLHVSILNSPIKKYRLSQLYAVYTHKKNFISTDAYKLKVKGWKRYYI
jgi:hypothetical protein